MPGVTLQIVQLRDFSASDVTPGTDCPAMPDRVDTAYVNRQKVIAEARVLEGTKGIMSVSSILFCCKEAHSS